MHLLKLLENQMQKMSVGTLTLGKKKCFCEVFLEQDSLYLAAQPFSGRIATDKLVQFGIPGRRVSLEKLESLIQNTDLTRNLLPQVLLDSDVISKHELVPLAEAQLTEEAIDLLSRNSGSFHFQNGRVPEYLLQCQAITTRVPVPISVVIEELRRRTRDTTHYETLIPSHEEVFVVTEKGLAVRQTQKANLALETILRLIDGFRDLRTIIKDTYLYEFHVISWVALALEEGYIKKTVHPELRGISTQSLGPSEIEDLLPFFKNSVKYGVDELAARERLAAVYEKAGKADDAVIQYNFIGDAFYRMQKQSKAIKAYQRALFLKPDEILITDKIAKIYREASDDELANRNIPQAIHLLEEALKIRPEDQEILTSLLELLVKEKKLREISNLCDWIVAHARKSNSPDLAMNACKQIVQGLPGNAAFRKKLVNLYLDAGRAPEACAEMEELARQYISRGQNDKAEELLEKLRRMGGAQRDTSALQRQLVSSRPRPEKVKRRVSWVQRTFLGFVAFLLVYQTLGYLAWNKIEDREALAGSNPGGSKETVSLLPGPRELKLCKRASHCEIFLKCFPFHIFTGDARDLLETTERQVQYLELLRNGETERVLTRAREAAQEGDKETSAKLIARLLELDPRDPRHQEAKLLTEEIQTVTRSAEDLLSDARKLEEKAKKSSNAANWRRVFRAYRQFLQTFPESQHVSRIRLPIWIESVPSGAEVTQMVGGEKHSTPFVCWLHPAHSLSVVLRAEGCEPLHCEIEAKHGERGIFKLSRKHVQARPLNGPVEQEPMVHGNLAVCGTTQGKLYVVDLEDPGRVWERGLGGGTVHQILAPPHVARNRILSVWNNGEVLSLPLTKRANGTLQVPQGEGRAFPLGGLPTTAFHSLKSHPYVAIGTSDAVNLYDSRTLASRGSIRLPGKPSCLSGLDADHLLVGTENGALIKVNVATRESKRITQDTGDAVLQAATFGDVAFTLTKGRYLVPWDLKTGDRGTPGVVRNTSTVLLLPKDDRIYILDDRGSLRVIAPTSKEDRSHEFNVKAVSLFPLPGALGIVHESDGPARHELLVVRRHDLQPLWGTSVDGEITTVSGEGPHVLVTIARQDTDGTKLGELRVYHVLGE